MKRVQDECIPYIYIIEYCPYGCSKWRIWFQRSGTGWSTAEEAEKFARKWFALDHPDNNRKDKVRIRKYKRSIVWELI